MCDLGLPVDPRQVADAAAAAAASAAAASAMAALDVSDGPAQPAPPAPMPMLVASSAAPEREAAMERAAAAERMAARETSALEQAAGEALLALLRRCARDEAAAAVLLGRLLSRCGLDEKIDDGLAFYYVVRGDLGEMEASDGAALFRRMAEHLRLSAGQRRELAATLL